MNNKELIRQIKAGKIFIYPTDTLYGIGCDATNKRAVNKIKNIKKRDKNNPLSVIAPSEEWIRENLVVDVPLKEYLPGPYTLIFKKKEKNFLKQCSETDLLGIRIPADEFTKKIQKSEVPFVTTTVNLSGEPPITKISQIPKEILDKVDQIIDIGPLTGHPSTLVIDGKEIKRK